jgi:hypothetical protein
VSAEIWAQIPAAPDYQASSTGRIRRASSARALSLNTISRGYRAVCLMIDGRRATKTVHALVCAAFNGPRPVGHEAAHWDGDRLNNRSENLRWATPLENRQDSFRHGVVARGERHGLAKLSAKDVAAIRSEYRPGVRGHGQHSLAKKYGVRQATVWKIINNLNWRGC